MSTPVPGQPGETPEQRQARFAAASAVQARIDAERRAQLEAQANPVSMRLPEPVGIPMPVARPPVGIPMPIGTSIAQQRPDPDFDINVAFNTMNKRLGELVNSGKMSLDQARAAQSEMRALQLNPAAANRQAATDIAQRHLQVGRYAPSQPQGGLTAIAPQPIREQPIQKPMRAYYDPSGLVMPQPPEREVIGYMTPPPGVRSGDTRIFADQPVTPPPMPERHSEYGIPLWMQLPPGPERDAAYAQFMKGQGGGMQPKGIGGMLQPDSGYGSQQPMISDMAYRGPYKKPRMLSPNDFSIARGPIPLDQQGPPLGGGIGAILGSLKTASQGVGGMPMPPKGLTLSNVPQQQRLTLSNVPQQGVAPQPMSAPQGMAMGGLMEKYYGGGMC